MGHRRLRGPCADSLHEIADAHGRDSAADQFGVAPFQLLDLGRKQLDVVGDRLLEVVQEVTTLGLVQPVNRGFQLASPWDLNLRPTPRQLQAATDEALLPRTVDACHETFIPLDSIEGSEWIASNPTASGRLKRQPNDQV